ncbi:MAG: transporter related, partial [Paenibacillus sp.]|nr:transporter related [Paenibacillus sp.]
MNVMRNNASTRRTAILLLTALCAMLLLAAAPWMFDSYYLNLLFMIGIFTITTAGMNVLIGYCGIVSIGHAGLMAVGAYVSAFLSTQFELSFWLVAIAGMAASLFIGSLIAIPTIRAGGVYLSMITIAFGVVIHEALIRWEWFTGGPLGISGIPKPAIGSYSFDLRGMYWLVLGIAVAALILVRNLRRSSWGRSMIAVKENEIAAASLGIRKFTAQFAGFALSSVLAGLSGALYAHANSFISPDSYHFQTSVQLVLIVILGGAGRVLGPVIGAAVIVMLPEVLQMEKLRLALYGAMMFVVLYFLPKGIVGTTADAASRWLRKLAPSGGGGGRHATRELPPEGNLVGTGIGGVSRELERGEALLRLEGIGKRFGGLHALKGVSLTVESGSIHSLVGPNGAGKTTLLNVISGLYTPDDGSMTLGGRLFSPGSLTDAAKLKIARTFQHSRLFMEMSVLENVMAGMAGEGKETIAQALFHTPGYRRKERETRSRAHALLDFIGYEGDREMKAAGLPYGHQRLIEMARALAVSPTLLLLDEPAAGMTSGEIDVLEALLKKLSHSGLTIVVIEHHMDFVERVSDAVTVLDFGSVIGTGEPKDMLKDPRVIQAYLGIEEEVAA